MTETELKARLQTINQIEVYPEKEGVQSQKVEILPGNGFSFSINVSFNCEFDRRGKLSRNVGDRIETEYLFSAEISDVSIEWIHWIKVGQGVITSDYLSDFDLEWLDLFNEILTPKIILER